jgi:hypothetical protein
MESSIFFRKPASNASSKPRKTKKNKQGIDSMFETEPDTSMLLETDRNNKMEDDDWIYPSEEKLKLPIENMDMGRSDDRIEPSEIELIRLYQKYKLQSTSLYRFTVDQEDETKTFKEYPLKWDYPCMHCGKHFDGVPVFCPEKYDTREKCWILQIWAQCSPVCAYGSIITGQTTKAEKLGDLHKFIREYFDPNIETIGYIPLSALKSRNPIGGYLTDEEWKKQSLSMTGMIKNPPFRFVDTSIQVLDRDREKERRNTDKHTNATVSPEMQKLYDSILQRVADQHKSRTGSSGSTLADNLGFVMKNGNK